MPKPVLLKNRGRCRVQQQRDGTWRVWVRVTKPIANPKGYLKRHMLVDTGAKRTCLSVEDAVEVLKLKPLEKKSGELSTVTVKTTNGKSERELARIRLESYDLSAAEVGITSAAMGTASTSGIASSSSTTSTADNGNKTTLVELTCSIRTGLLEGHGILGRDWITVAQPVWEYYVRKGGGAGKNAPKGSTIQIGSTILPAVSGGGGSFLNKNSTCTTTTAMNTNVLARKTANTNVAGTSSINSRRFQETEEAMAEPSSSSSASSDVENNNRGTSSGSTLSASRRKKSLLQVRQGQHELQEHELQVQTTEIDNVVDNELIMMNYNYTSENMNPSRSRSLEETPGITPDGPVSGLGGENGASQHMVFLEDALIYNESDSYIRARALSGDDSDDCDLEVDYVGGDD
ncbi:unnamed protein product [Amoebophrya sp. A25]|nr:unnamed protein product [Amoebophrya sp. A25]|eukprot:GSA25T00022293001.1